MSTDAPRRASPVLASHPPSTPWAADSLTEWVTTE